MLNKDREFLEFFRKLYTETCLCIIRFGEVNYTMVSDNIMVSVIMITYNHERFIREAIDSILMQKTNFCFEILIGDDASTDGTGKIVSEYADRFPNKIHAVIRTENIGATKNAYDILCRAKGKYLASCEGDDYWTDEYKLQKQVDVLEKNPQYVACVHPIGLVDVNGKRIFGPKPFQISHKRVFSIHDFKGCILPGHGVSTVRRNFMLQSDFDREIIYKANPNICDRTCVLLWLARGNYYRLNQKMANYRIIKNGTNTTNVQYKHNIRRFADDYEYTRVLQGYALTKLHVDGRFEIHIRDLFAKAMISYFFKRNLVDKKLMERIIRENGHPLRMYLSVFPFIFKKLFLYF